MGSLESGREVIGMRVRLRALVFLVCFFLAGSIPFGADAADMSSVATLAKPTPGGVPWSAAQISALHRAVRRILRGTALQGAEVGFLAIDTVRGTTLYARNANRDFVPASNFKLLVGSTALRYLGTVFAYVTTVDAQSAPVNGEIAGDLYLRGGGDALLSAKDLDDAAAALAAVGVKRVDGSVIADASYFDDQRWGYGWSWDDLPFYYAPVISALELEDGIVHVFMTPGATPGSPVELKVEPQSSAYAIEDRLTTGPAGSKDTSK
ncbi:MAG: D-alanyl-D-alanine carboxypeptidase, partial [Vulcanimicrobiaceae bacterium]